MQKQSERKQFCKMNSMAAQESWEWRRGPYLPVPLAGAASVQLEDTFAVVGGTNRFGNAGADVYIFDKDKYVWRRSPERLKGTLSSHPGVGLITNQKVAYY